MTRTSTGPPAIHDRDLDGALVVRPSRGHGWEGDPRHQRLVANPFLGLFAFLALLEVARWTLAAHHLPGFLVAIGLITQSTRLLQFHCLDCGATGWLKSWRRHRCAHVEARRAAGRPRFPRGPSPPTQVLGWFVLIALGLCWYVIHLS